MALVLCALTLCGPPHGGHAVSPGARGGQAHEPPVPHLVQLTCIHKKEAAWNDAGDPYWGGLQMDRGFMDAYGADMIRYHHGGLANTWTPKEQMQVAERAILVRGFTPWPNTRHHCA